MKINGIVIPGKEEHDDIPLTLVKLHLKASIRKAYCIPRGEIVLVKRELYESGDMEELWNEFENTDGTYEFYAVLCNTTGDLISTVKDFLIAAVVNLDCEDDFGYHFSVNIGRRDLPEIIRDYSIDYSEFLDFEV